VRSVRARACDDALGKALTPPEVQAALSALTDLEMSLRTRGSTMQRAASALDAVSGVLTAMREVNVGSSSPSSALSDEILRLGGRRRSPTPIFSVHRWFSGAQTSKKALFGSTASSKRSNTPRTTRIEVAQHVPRSATVERDSLNRGGFRIPEDERVKSGCRVALCRRSLVLLLKAVVRASRSREVRRATS